MKRKYLLTTLLLTVTTLHGQAQSFENYMFNRAPLTQKTYTKLPLGSIRAEGWLLDQLSRQRSGLTGHLDEIYATVCGARNAWLGGDGDAWERGPYWIDGLLPLAYILDDATLKAKVQPWVEHILASQQENGQFGPVTDRPYEEGMQRDNAQDWWPRMVVLKILQQYYQATGDQRIPPFLTRYFRYQLAQLPKQPLGHWTFWGEQRGGDNLQVVLWLYNLTGEEFLLDLARLIHRQTFNWTEVFLNGDHLQRQLSLHCVNLAQGFKEPVVFYQVNGDNRQLEAMKRATATIRNTIGLPTGLWGGDELLRFGDPTAGSEFCTATEMMFSLESILEITGQARWADYLERVAYNALPTQHTDDFNGRQYYQQTNQVAATLAWRQFSTPHDDTDIVFGTLNGYACCLCNMHQGWPKLVQNLWYATADKGVAALVYGPSKVTANVGDNRRVSIQEQTNYPFSDNITFTVSLEKKKAKAATFPIHLRIPGWCQSPQATVNGKPVQLNVNENGIAIVEGSWNNGDQLVLSLPMTLQGSQWYSGGGVIERGPLLYALRLDEQWQRKLFGERRGYGTHYDEVTTTSSWNYGLPHRAIEHPADYFTVEVHEPTAGSYPWNTANAPIILKGKGLRMNDWKEVRGCAGPISYFTQQGHDWNGEDDITLIPYGCTTLRIALFPIR